MNQPEDPYQEHLHGIMPVRKPANWLITLLVFSMVPASFAGPGAVNPAIPGGDTVDGQGVWLDPAIEKAADGPIRVTVWFDRQFLGDGKAYERRIRECAGIGRRELRTRTVALLKQLSGRSYADAKDALYERLRKGEIREIERHWIVNGFSCNTNAAGAKALAGVPGVKKIFDTRDQLPLPRTKLAPVTTSVRPASRPNKPVMENLPWYIPLVQADRVWKEFGVAGEGTLNVVNDTNFILSPSNSSSIYQNPGEVADNGIDDDGNGLVDDSHGFNFHLRSAMLTTENHTGGDEDKSILHGNNCANIICGSATDGIAPLFGIAPLGRWAGVASAPHIRITGCIESAVEWSIDHQADTYNMSYSIPNLGEFRSHWRKIMEQGAFCGVYFVSGAGNYGQKEKVPTQMRVPEDIPGAVFAVSGIQRDLSRSAFSSMGPVEWMTEHYHEGIVAKPEVCAFNKMLPIVMPDGTVMEDKISGNSYAGPMLAGTIALMLSADPELLPWDAREIILASATDAGPPGVDFETGHGFINCYKAVEEVLRRKKQREPE
jgi:subtilisin family serine protease